MKLNEFQPDNSVEFKVLKSCYYIENIPGESDGMGGRHETSYFKISDLGKDALREALLIRKNKIIGMIKYLIPTIATLATLAITVLRFILDYKQAP